MVERTLIWLTPALLVPLWAPSAPCRPAVTLRTARFFYTLTIPG
jgi:hypothetical protein